MLGPLICIQLEANGSATYLTKVTAPDAKQQPMFRILRFPVRQYSRRRRSPSGSRWYFSNAGAAYMYQDRGQWLCDLLKQGRRSRCKAASDHFGILRFSVGQYSRRRRSPSGSRVALQMLGPLICIRIEANGSATYLTKVAAPDAKQQPIISDTPFLSPAIFSP